MKTTIALFIASTQAIKLEKNYYGDNELAIGSQWGLKPTRTWVNGVGGDTSAVRAGTRDSVVVPSGQEDAEKAYKEQWEHFAVDSIHQSADVQLDEQEGKNYYGGNPEEVGSQWGLKPTQTWVPGVGGDTSATRVGTRDTVVVPSGQEDAEKAYKEQYEHFAVDSIHQSADVQLAGDGYYYGGNPESIGSQWGLKPTRTWIDGPGGDTGAVRSGTRDTVVVPSGQADAEARQKEQEHHFAVDSVVGSHEAQRSVPSQWIDGPGGDTGAVRSGSRDTVVVASGQADAEQKQKEQELRFGVDSVNGQNRYAQYLAIEEYGMTPVPN